MELNPHIKIIFILGVHKSGTSLMRSLFDAHSQIFTIPFESHIAHLLNWETRYPLRAEKPADEFTIETFFERAIAWAESINCVENGYADSQLVGQLDIGIFKQVLLNGEKPTNERELIFLYFQAIQESILHFNGKGKVIFVEKSVENMEHAGRLRKLFPQAEFISIIRNPYANLVTLRKYFLKMNPQYPMMDRAIRSIRDGFYYLQANQELLSPKRIIKYEDLITEPETTMKMLAKILKLRFEAGLLEPTSLGQPWGGNSVNDKKFTKISSLDINRWRQDINSLEISLVNQFLSTELHAYGYDMIDQPKRSWMPVKKEGLKTFISNRVLLKRG